MRLFLAATCAAVLCSVVRAEPPTAAQPPATRSPGQPAASPSRAAQPEAAQPEAAQPEAAQPEAAQPEAGAEEQSTTFWMQKKMEYTQDILRGLATENYQDIGVHARQMRLLSKVEGFVRGRNADYRSQLHTFERVCDEMIQQADRENLAGVTLAFNQLTVSCVSCHQTLRKAANGQPSLSVEAAAEPSPQGE